MAYQPLGDKSVQNFIDALNSNSVFAGLSQSQKILCIDRAQQECARLSKENNLKFYNTDDSVYVDLSKAVGMSRIAIRKQTVLARAFATPPQYILTGDINIGKQTLTTQTLNEIIDGYSQVNCDNHINFTNGMMVSESFTGDGRDFVAYQAFLVRQAGHGTGYSGTFTAKLYAHSGTYGTSSVPTGSVLATSDGHNALELPIGDPTNFSNYSLIEFVFATPYTLNAGTHYCVAIEFVGASTGFDYASIGYDGSSVPSNIGNLATYSGSWSADGNSALGFWCFVCTHTHVTSSISISKQTVYANALYSSTSFGTAGISVSKQSVYALARYISPPLSYWLNGSIQIKKQTVDADSVFLPVGLYRLTGILPVSKQSVDAYSSFITNSVAISGISTKKQTVLATALYSPP